MKMKNAYHFFGFIVLIFISSLARGQYSAEGNKSNSAATISKDKVERYELKILDIKRKIEAADSLYNAGEKTIEKAAMIKSDTRNEIKLLKKTYKQERKQLKKILKSGNASDLKLAEEKSIVLDVDYKSNIKSAENEIIKADKMIANGRKDKEKADKKLDILSSKLKKAEKMYQDAKKKQEK
jgi:hypothetical protein